MSIFKELEFFTEAEFREWAFYMDHNLLFKLDDLRAEWGSPIYISPAFGALGRRLGQESLSQHNIDRYDTVRAVDIMPQRFKGEGKISNVYKEFYKLALELGFTGIGIYPDWRPNGGAHLDVRENRNEGDPATWSAYNINGIQKYFGIERAFPSEVLRSEGNYTISFRNPFYFSNKDTTGA